MKEVDSTTNTKCVQATKQRDDSRIENNPGLFAAEQTWPTPEEISRGRKGSHAGEEMGEVEPVDLSHINPVKKGDELTGLMDRMQISVVGREHGNDSDFEDMDDDEEDDEIE